MGSHTKSCRKHSKKPWYELQICIHQGGWHENTDKVINAFPVPSVPKPYRVQFVSIGHRTCDWWTAYGQRSQGNPLAKGFLRLFSIPADCFCIAVEGFWIFGSYNYNLDFQLRKHQLVYMGSTRCWPFVFAPTCLSCSFLVFKPSKVDRGWFAIRFGPGGCWKLSRTASREWGWDVRKPQLNRVVSLVFSRMIFFLAANTNNSTKSWLQVEDPLRMHKQTPESTCIHCNLYISYYHLLMVLLYLGSKWWSIKPGVSMPRWWVDSAGVYFTSSVDFTIAVWWPKAEKIGQIGNKPWVLESCQLILGTTVSR